MPREPAVITSDQLAKCPVTAFERSRPAADATREVVERWLLYGL
jgi:hypothetical protein